MLTCDWMPADDPYETTNLAGPMADKASDLSKLLTEISQRDRESAAKD